MKLTFKIQILPFIWKTIVSIFHSACTSKLDSFVVMCCDLEKLSFIEKLASWNRTCKKITVPSTMTKCDKDVPMSNQDP